MFTKELINLQKIMLISTTYTSLSDIDTLYQEQRALSNGREVPSVEERIAALQRLRKVIVEKERALMDALYTDLGKSDYESYLTEIGVALKEIDFHCKRLKRWSRPRRVGTPWFLLPSKSRLVAEPYGQVLIMAPWNYPFQLLINPLVGAISAGNRAVLRPSPAVPHVAAVIQEIIELVFPTAWVAVVQGDIAENQHLLSKRWDYIFFTGGPFLGKIVAEAAAKYITPVTLELGGKSPCIVDLGCDIAQAAKRVIWGKSVNAGQTCIAPDYVWVHQSLKQDFLLAVEEAIADMYDGDTLHSKDYGRIVNEKSFARLKSYLNEGVTWIRGGGMDEGKKYMDIAVVEVSDPQHPLMKEEIFGPILPIRTFSSLTEVIQDINSGEKPLALYYFGKQSNAWDVIKATSSGGVAVNDTIVHVANHHLPFGGVGGSGYGAYRGKHTFEIFSHFKGVLLSPTWFDLPLKYPPYGSLKFLKKFLG